MSKYLKSFSFFFVFLLINVGCQEKTKEDPDQPTEPREVDPPKQLITLDDADSLYVNYSTRRAENIIRFEMQDQPDGEPFNPTRFVSFDLKVIKDYIAYVEQEAKNAGVKADSLRIYLGNYGKRGKDKRRNTVFLLPTANTDAGYGGFYIGDDGKAKLIRDKFRSNDMEQNDPKSKASLMPNLNSSLFQGEQSLILNFGNSGPPPRGDF